MKYWYLYIFSLLCFFQVYGIEIVIPANANLIEKYAANELLEHLTKAGANNAKVVNKASEKVLAIKLGRASTLDIKRLPKNGSKVKISNSIIDIAGKDGAGNPLDFKVECGTLFGVYEFLEKELSVRFLWPGNLGTVIPKRKNFSFGNKEYEVAPPMNFSVWRISPRLKNGWNSVKNANIFYQAEKVWLRRHRFNTLENLAYGHAFVSYMKKYGKSNPDIFNLLPNNSRKADPLYFNGNSALVSMCVSNPNLVKIILENWIKRPDRIINLNENDTAGKCVCPSCIKLDLSPNKDRVEKAKKLFLVNNPQWYKELGSLSERYASFYLAVQKEADKINPLNKIIGCIYANYYLPPVKNKLNNRIIMRFCPPIMYPWTKDKVKKFKDLWQGWYDSNATLMMRPNFTLDGHNMPLMYYKEFVDCFDFAKKRGLKYSDFDSLTGMFGANAITLYTIAAKNGGSCNKSVTELENDFFSAFGKAEPLIREYVNLMTSASAKGDKSNNTSIEGGNYAEFFLHADKVFSPQVMTKGKILLDKALKAVEKDSIEAKRVKFLKAGFDDANIVLEAQRGYRQYKKNSDFKLFSAQLRKLAAFRAANEHLGYADLGVCDYLESRYWPMHLAKLGDNSRELTNWTFSFDPNNLGIKEKWFELPNCKWDSITTNSHWEKTSLYAKYLKSGGKKRLTGWYRNVFFINGTNQKQKAKISFGAIDGDADIYLNGKLVFSRQYPDNGDVDSWKKPFAVDVTGKLRNGQNILVVKIHKKECYPGFSGIWRSVFITLGDVEAENMDVKSWKSNFPMGTFKVKKSNYPLILTCTEKAKNFNNPYNGVWGRLYRIEKVIPGQTYEIKIQYRQKGNAIFSAWLRSKTGNLSDGNINISSPRTEETTRTIVGRIKAGSNKCSIYLTLLKEIGEIEIISVKFYPVLTFYP